MKKQIKKQNKINYIKVKRVKRHKEFVVEDKREKLKGGKKSNVKYV